jgi:hypothetical protein
MRTGQEEKRAFKTRLLLPSLLMDPRLRGEEESSGIVQGRFGSCLGGVAAHLRAKLGLPRQG